MKQLIEQSKQQELSESKQIDQIKWELPKCKIRKFAITVSRLFHKILEKNNVN